MLSGGSVGFVDTVQNSGLTIDFKEDDFANATTVVVFCFA